MIESFRDDDAGYLAWVAEHEADGFVLNHERGGMAEARLHRAGCRTIRRHQAGHEHWTREYVKACSTSRTALEAFAGERGGTAAPCGLCSP